MFIHRKRERENEYFIQKKHDTSSITFNNNTNIKTTLKVF